MTGPVLLAEGLTVRYGSGSPAVADVDLEVHAGEVVTLLGPNGAGKTTTLLALAGSLAAYRGQVQLWGRRTTAPMHRRIRAGLGLVTEQRCTFGSLTARQNLVVGRGELSRALELFPELEPHLDRPAGLLSGGQQQMLALGRALASRPTVLLADELSLGLAPVIVQRLLTTVSAAAHEDGVAVLLVEQHVTSALAIADRSYVIRRGRVAHLGPAADLRASPDRIAAMYLERSA